GASSGKPSGPTSYRPEVKIISPKYGSVFSNEGLVSYEATDKNDETGGVLKKEFGLIPLPVSIFYSDKIAEWDHTITKDEDKVFIVKDLPAIGSYVWRIKDLIPGALYRIVVDAIDAVGDIGEDVSDFFSVDFTAPTFIVGADPSVTAKLGDVKISIEASKDLVTPPIVKVRQHGGEAVLVKMEGAGQFFEGVYKILAGYDGTATIEVSGSDRAGNRGTTITGGGTFSVGVNPPPAPEIIFPLNKTIATSSEITVRGSAREDSIVTLTVNGVEKYTPTLSRDGQFVIDKVKLKKDSPHGGNVLSAVARDQGGSLSEATIIHVSFNLAPTLSLITPEDNTVLSATTTLLARVTDENGDRVISRFESLPAGAFNKGETEWSLLGETISGKLIFDTTEISDGAYLIRAVADDGATTKISDFRLVTIKNQLPTIKFDDGRRTYTNKNTASVRGSVIAPDIPSRPTITRLEYSTNGGKSWITLSAEERFSVPFEKLREGSNETLWRATDSRGFIVRVKYPIIVDTVAPKSPNISFPRSGVILSDADDEDRKKQGLQFTIRGTAEPHSSVAITVAESTYKTQVALDGSWRQSITISARGSFVIEATAIDPAGNKSLKTSVSIIHDNPPKIAFLNPRDGRGASGITKVSWLLKDPDGDAIKDVVLSYRQGNGEFKILTKTPKENSFNWDTTSLSAGGNYYLRLEASDGVIAVNKTIPIFIDRTAPVLLSLTFSKKTFASRGTLTATGKAGDDMSGVEFIEYRIVPEGDTNNNVAELPWLKGTVTGGFLSKNTPFSIQEPLRLSDGTYGVFVRAVDASGNTSKELSEIIIIDGTAPRVGTVALSYRSASISPTAGNFIIPIDTPLTFLLSLESDTKGASVVIGTTTYKLTKDTATGLWKTDFTLSKIATTTLSVSTVDVLGNKGKDNKVAPFVAIPDGKIIYFENNKATPVPGAKIEVRVYDPSRKTFVSFGSSSSSYGQFTATADGGYFLALPRGTYQLIISGNGFKQLKTDGITLNEAQFIIRDFTLEKKISLWSMIKALFSK
ncbi:MAG: carboxypeptidase-like regulatory domain-containing protein, partial [Patescibacteria group bacterium]